MRCVSTALDLIYPPRCAGCGKIDTPLCSQCKSELLLPIQPVHLFVELLAHSAATGQHSGVLREIVQAFKYDNAHELVDVLTARLATAFTFLAWQVDILVPVPLHARRARERGYNQSELLAQKLADSINIPCKPSAIRRTRDTPHQVGLTREQRKTNVNGAFQAESTLLADKAVLLIDDVTTTGATLAACALAALEAGALSVWSLTVSAADTSTS